MTHGGRLTIATAKVVEYHEKKWGNDMRIQKKVVSLQKFILYLL